MKYLEKEKILSVSYKTLLCPRYFTATPLGGSNTEPSFSGVYWWLRELRRRPEIQSGYANRELRKIGAVDGELGHSKMECRQ